MTIELKMPALSPTMEKGTLAKWLIAPGGRIRVGDMVAEIETDKATMELEAEDEGILDSILVAEGSADIPVGTVIAVLRANDGSTAVSGDLAPPAKESTVDEERDVQPQPPAMPERTAPVAPSRADPAPPAHGTEANGRANATPLALRIAVARGLDLSNVSGTGPGGKVVKADVAVQRAKAAPPAKQAAVPNSPPAAVPTIPHEAVTLSTMRRTIARRLTESKTTVPHFYISNDCRLDALLALRGEMNSALAEDGAKLSINDFLIKALALALRRVPDANVQFADDTLYQFSRADISVAVAIDGGLITPVIADAGAKSVTAISAEAKDLAARARAGRLKPEDYQGGTASLSNLGMFGAREIIPVINPPQAVIVGIGAGREVPCFGPDGVIPSTILTATGSFDHRAIDGATGARLMQAFQSLVENPMKILA